MNTILHKFGYTAFGTAVGEYDPTVDIILALVVAAIFLAFKRRH